MNPARRTLLVQASAACTWAAFAPGQAQAQLAVIDTTAVAQAIKQVSQGLQQIQALQNQLRQQAQMLQRLGLDVTAPLRAITSEATALLQQARGLGYQAANLGAALAQAYPTSLAGFSPQDIAAKLQEWARNSRSTLQEAMEVQNQIALAQPATASAVSAAVSASQAAAGQTAAVQATNQLLAALSTQLMQLQTLLITQGRQTETLEAERRGLMARAESDSLRNRVVKRGAPRFGRSTL